MDGFNDEVRIISEIITLTISYTSIHTCMHNSYNITIHLDEKRQVNYNVTYDEHQKFHSDASYYTRVNHLLLICLNSLLLQSSKIIRIKKTISLK